MQSLTLMEGFNASSFQGNKVTNVCIIHHNMSGILGPKQERKN